MAFYFFVTYAVLVVTFYASFLIDDYKIDSSFSGVLISLFFLAIMLPGLFIANIIRSLKRNVNLVALVLVCVGLLCVGVFHGKAMLAFGALCTGLGYGIMQPVIYDKAATIAPPRSATLALSFVMSVNYLAVMVCPFIVDLFRHVFGTHSDRFPFFFNAVLVLAVAVVTLLRRDSFTLGLDGPITGIDCKNCSKVLMNDVKRFKFVLKSHTLLRLSRDENNTSDGFGRRCPCGRLLKV